MVVKSRIVGRGSVPVLLGFVLGLTAFAAGGAGPDGRIGSTAPLVSRGRALFEENGCGACHSIDGARRLGPSLLGLWGQPRVMSDGSRVVMDEDYFEQSVLEPQALVVRGYAASMPSYRNVIAPEDLPALAAYVRSLRRPDTGPDVPTARAAPIRRGETGSEADGRTGREGR